MKTLGYIFAGLLALVAIVGIVYGAMFVFAPARVIEQDIQRNVVQHSQAYVQSKQQELLGLITDYNDPAATSGQKKAIENQFCYTVTLLIPQEWSRPIALFEQEHC